MSHFLTIRHLKIGLLIYRINLQETTYRLYAIQLFPVESSFSHITLGGRCIIACTFAAEHKRQFSVLFRLLKRDNFSPPTKAWEVQVQGCKRVLGCKHKYNRVCSYGEDVHGKTNIAIIYIVHSYVPWAAVCSVIPGETPYRMHVKKLPNYNTPVKSIKC